MSLLALSLFAATICSPAKGVCEEPLPADSIADSLGVNVHLHSGDTIYADFSLIKRLLRDLGARHTRDGLIDTTWNEYYRRHVELAKIGIKCLFITSPGQKNVLLTSWPERVRGSFEGYESPNEYDLSRDPDWPSTIKRFVRQLYIAVKSDPRTAVFPIIGPSLTKDPSYAELRGLQQYFDYGNMHNYFGGRNPGTSGWGDGGYGSIAYNINLNKAAWPDKPLVTTETGYLTDQQVDQGIPELVEGKYAPRMLLEQALHGVTRTYIYELIDEGASVAGKDGSFGLARINGSPKPAYVALRTLMTTLSDPGPRTRPRNLQYSLGSASPRLHHLLMMKNDGSYYLAFWLEVQNYDVDKHKELAVPGERFSFMSGQAFKEQKLITFAPDGESTTTLLETMHQTSLMATDCLSILVLR